MTRTALEINRQFAWGAGGSGTGSAIGAVAGAGGVEAAPKNTVGKAAPPRLSGRPSRKGALPDAALCGAAAAGFLGSAAGLSHIRSKR